MLERYPAKDFNPTLVQLEFSESKPSAPRRNYFNPTLVQLECFCFRSSFSASQAFQSHIGAIRMWILPARARADTQDFNPTLVQLEWYLNGIKILFRQNFNPTLVQLESEKLRDCKSIEEDFNPTLVQLEWIRFHIVKQVRVISIPHWCN